jgi:hypothetical protein
MVFFSFSFAFSSITKAISLEGGVVLVFFPFFLFFFDLGAYLSPFFTYIVPFDCSKDHLSFMASLGCKWLDPFKLILQPSVLLNKRYMLTTMINRANISNYSNMKKLRNLFC